MSTPRQVTCDRHKEVMLRDEVRMWWRCAVPGCPNTFTDDELFRLLTDRPGAEHHELVVSEFYGLPGGRVA